MVILTLAPDQTIAQRWSNGARGEAMHGAAYGCPMRSPSRVTRKIFAVLVGHHIVLTMSCKLVSFYIYQR